MFYIVEVILHVPFTRDNSLDIKISGKLKIKGRKKIYLMQTLSERKLM